MIHQGVYNSIYVSVRRARPQNHCMPGPADLPGSDLGFESLVFLLQTVSAISDHASNVLADERHTN